MSSIDKEKKVRCSVKNCQKEIEIDKAIKIKGNYYCGICGVAYMRSALNI